MWECTQVDFLSVFFWTVHQLTLKTSDTVDCIFCHVCGTVVIKQPIHLNAMKHASNTNSCDFIECIYSIKMCYAMETSLKTQGTWLCEWPDTKHSVAMIHVALRYSTVTLLTLTVPGTTIDALQHFETG